MSIFGAMMTTLSSFGQTFLLALYVPFLIEEFKITNSLISSFYGVATIASALMLPKLGKFIDTVPLKRFTLMTTAVFLISLVFFSFSWKWWHIPLAFFGLRLAGQGLFSHIAITSMSRYFLENRGKAISVASLGHPLGQAVLPAITLLVIAQIGWRESLWVNAALVGIIVTFFVIFAIKPAHLQPESILENQEEVKKTSQKVDKVRQRDILKSRPFWLLAPNVFFIPFAITGLFFYQFGIVEFKEWGVELVAFGLTAFAIASAFSILTAGPLIDKYSAKTFFPFYLIPFLVALLIIWLVKGPMGMFGYMIFMGLSVGFGNATIAALQVEFFGQKYIGTVRSLFTSMMVLSSAVGPALFGVILDAGLGFNVVFMISIGLLVLIILLSLRAIPTYSRAKWKYKYRKKFKKT
ncbi:MFS transporter [Rhodonellum sp.]|uniref:MFS transporter n=1 Tax=Rhodonellum sp. TaxID=2231180 RepID=UPI00272592C5|nr:MFS transporter [Rhodonellum sp.]MDO9551232.1 MFS transporter [Rhodonellum sp.]